MRGAHPVLPIRYDVKKGNQPMVRKMIGVFAVAGVLASSAIALAPTQARAHHNHTGSVVGALVGGAVLGAALSSTKKSHPRAKYYYYGAYPPPPPPVYYPAYPAPQPCGYAPYPPCRR